MYDCRRSVLRARLWPPAGLRARPWTPAGLVAGLCASMLLGAPGAARAEPRRVSLDELTALAMAGPRADMARREAEGAEARAREAAAARHPRVTVTSFVAPSPEIRCDNPDCTRTTPPDLSFAVAGVYAGVRVSALQPIYTFGKLDAAGRAAQAAARATVLAEGVVAADLALEAARAYHGLKLARELVWMLEDGVAEIDRALARMEERLAEGQAAEPVTGQAAEPVTVQDRLRVQTLRAEALARVSEAREAEAVALAGVRALAGDPELDVDEQPLEAVALELDAVDTYLARARAQRPELAAARAGAEAAGAVHDLASAGAFPDLVAVGELEVARAQGVDDPPSAFARDPFNTTTGAVALTLRWQLDVVAQRARVAQARAQARRAAALVELADAAAGFEIQAAHAQAREARARMNALAAGVSSARGWMTAVLQADIVGAAEARELADAFIAYVTTRARHATSIHEWNLAVARLGRAAGELTEPGPRVRRARESR